MGLADQLSAVGATTIIAAVLIAPQDKELSQKLGYIGSALLLFGGLGDIFELITVILK